MINITRQELVRHCKTGDIILFKGAKWYSKLIEWFCEISHVGIIIIDPFIDNKIVKGIYVLESKLFENGKNGVRLTSIDAIFSYVDSKEYSNIYIRFLHHVRDTRFKLKIDTACQTTLGKKYDVNPYDWFRSICNLKIGNEQKTERFWCSALVAYVYIKLGFLDLNIPWTIIKPSAFSSDCKNVLDFKCNLSNDFEIIMDDKLVYHPLINE